MPPKKTQQQEPNNPPGSDTKDEKTTNEKDVDTEQTANLLSNALTLIQNNKDLQSKEHKFWNTQPVIHFGDKVEDMGPIDAIKTVAEIQKETYRLPDGFEWVETDVNDEKTMKEVYTLLNENYVEDDDNMFRFDYSMEFLQWALKPPGYRKDWHIGVRATKSGKLLAFITAIPALVAVYSKPIKMVEINFLCVHKKLRDKRLAPVLIKEITRRVNLTDVWQAVYTAGRVIPTPVAQCRYYHRSLNPKKLIEVGFSHLAPRMTIARTIKLYKLPDEPQLKGIRPLEKKDVPSACKLLNKYLEQFGLRQVFEEDEFEHWFMSREDIINTFVIESPQTHNVTDMLSFYTLPSTIIGNDKYKSLKAAYSYYNVASTVDMKDLITDALILARKLNFDVYNCLDVMDNESVLKDLKFGKGDGNLQYYLYNWRCTEMPPKKVGLVLL